MDSTDRRASTTFHRSPRDLLPRLPSKRIAIAAPPTVPERSGEGILSMLLPVRRAAASRRTNVCSATRARSAQTSPGSADHRTTLEWPTFLAGARGLVFTRLGAMRVWSIVCDLA